MSIDHIIVAMFMRCVYHTTLIDYIRNSSLSYKGAVYGYFSLTLIHFTALVVLLGSAVKLLARFIEIIALLK